MQSRRQFLKQILVAGGLLALQNKSMLKASAAGKMTEDAQSLIYRATNGSPHENLAKVVDLMGGIEKLIGSEDVVVIKPNVQWWNQGTPNLAALKTFVDLIMDRPGGFKGEVVLAENCHRGLSPWQHEQAGWAHKFERNADLPNISNMRELSEALKQKYGERFSTCHWINVDAGAHRVYHPADGSGYVYCDGTRGVPLITCENGAQGSDQRAAIMTYPIFKTDKGTIVDFKNGIWERGAYTDQTLRFVNFSALNHHSTYCGMTSAVKNYLGITDLSGGPDPYNGGRLTKEYYNFHSFPFNKWAPGPEPGILGKAVGVFMETIRKADLNITTAEWVGLSSRTDPPVARTRAVLASTDPVALDFHAAKYVLYPNSKLSIHNPDDAITPAHQYLRECAVVGGGIFDESLVAVKSYDLKEKAFQQDDDLVVIGKKDWGTNIKALLKYLVLRRHKL
jgi:hypothetical protein